MFDRVLLGECRRPRIGVGHPHGTGDHDTADDPDRDVGPHRAELEAVPLPTSPAGDQTEQDGGDPEPRDDPTQGLPERSPWPATEQLERGVERCHRPSPGELERDATPDQQAAQRHDEGWDPDVCDEEALHAADQRADCDADQDDDDPEERAIEAGTQDRRDPFDLEEPHHHHDEDEDRPDGQVDVAGHDDQDHAGRQDGDGR